MQQKPLLLVGAAGLLTLGLIGAGVDKVRDAGVTWKRDWPHVKAILRDPLGYYAGIHD